jgi:hypothetical protein
MGIVLPSDPFAFNIEEHVLPGIKRFFQDNELVGVLANIDPTLQSMLITDFYNETKNLLEKNKCRKAYGKKVCSVRRSEGVFINNSLASIRDVIKEIMYEKNKDSINITPFFLEPCLQSYCEDGQCFKLNKPQKPNKSDIFNTILQELGRSSYSSLKDLIVGVFCVVNLSRKANNPPPVPYIDTNNVYFHLNNAETVTQELIDAVNKLVTNLQEFERNDAYVKVSIDKYLESSLDNVQSQLPGFKAKNSKLPASSKKIIIEFLTALDNISAASAMGTLQFVDSISKYYSSQVLCASDNVRNHPLYNTIIQRLKLEDIVNSDKFNMR